MDSDFPLIACNESVKHPLFLILGHVKKTDGILYRETEGSVSYDSIITSCVVDFFSLKVSSCSSYVVVVPFFRAFGIEFRDLLRGVMSKDYHG